MKKSVFQVTGQNAIAGNRKMHFLFPVYYIYGGTKYD